jgi:hypothetical protein
MGLVYLGHSVQICVVNKDFQVSVARKGEDKDPKKLYFSVYLWIQNLLNTKNIISVYRYTGNANDDGYLDAPQQANRYQQ